MFFKVCISFFNNIAGETNKKTIMETKFRGIISETNTWAYGSLIQDVRSRYIVEKDSKIWTSYPPDHDETKDTQLRTFGKIVIPETVGQLSPFSDSEKTKIYEHDIIGFWYDNDGKKTLSASTVFFDELTGQWMLDESSKQDRSFSTSLYAELNDYDYLVRGNIHANPELLTAKIKTK